MRFNKSLSLPIAATFLAVLLTATCVFPTGLVVAEEPKNQNILSSQDLKVNTQTAVPTPAVQKAQKRVAYSLSRADRIAALESVQFGLSRVSDGSSYIWHRSHGRLSGVVRPTKSFKDRAGKICRHFEVIYVSGDLAKRLETVACRLDNGVWEISG